MAQLQSSQEPEHLAYAKELAITSSEAVPCFQFVIDVLQQKAPEVYEELTAHHKQLLLKLDERYQTEEMIPYYYSLLPFDHLETLQLVSISDAQPGDLFIYIDKEYNPDPSSRAPNTPSGTHVGFINSIEEDKIILLDSSKRRRGRCFRTADSNIIPPEKNLIAYSFLTITTDSHTRLSELNFKGQRRLNNKYIYILKVMRRL